MFINNVLLPDIANPNYTDEVSFSVGETMEVNDHRFDWWKVRKLDGTQGREPLLCVRTYSTTHVHLLSCAVKFSCFICQLGIQSACILRLYVISFFCFTPLIQFNW